MSQVRDMLKIYGLFLASLLTLLGAVTIGAALSVGDPVIAVVGAFIGGVMCAIGMGLIWLALRKSSAPLYQRYPSSQYPGYQQYSYPGYAQPPLVFAPYPLYPNYQPYQSYPSYPAPYQGYQQPYYPPPPPPDYGEQPPPPPDYQPPPPPVEEEPYPPPTRDTGEYPPPPEYRPYEEPAITPQYREESARPTQGMDPYAPQSQEYYPPPPPQHYQSPYGYQPPFPQPGYPQAYPPGPYPTGFGQPAGSAKLDLPDISTLFWIFITAIIIGGVSLAAGGPLIFIFPFAFVIAFSFPSIMWISYVYKKDVHEPEPRRTVMIALTFGFLSTILAITLSFPFVIIFPSVVVGAVIVAPLVEELCKASGLRFVKKDIDSEMDGLIYGVTIGMGFAMVENFLYELGFVFSDPAVWTFGSLLRGLGSTMVHGLGTGMIGYAYASYRLNKDRPGAFNTVIMAYIAAVGLHALWNGSAVITGESPIGLLIIVLIAISNVVILRQLVSIAEKKDMVRMASGQYSPVDPAYLPPQEPAGRIPCPNCFQTINLPGTGPMNIACTNCGVVLNLR